MTTDSFPRRRSSRGIRRPLPGGPAFRLGGKTGILLLAIASLALRTPARAASLTADLGMGLYYCRIHSLPADLPTDDRVRNHACVIDVRFLKSDPQGAGALAAWLKFHASRRNPVFLVANAETGPEVRAVAGAAPRAPGVLLVAPDGSGLRPDAPVRVSRSLDRRAYEAAEKGRSIPSLLADSRSKPRNDEAMLEEQHLPDTAIPEDPDPRAGAEPSPPLMDRVLLRAVQLHSALVALKRL